MPEPSWRPGDDDERAPAPKRTPADVRAELEAVRERARNKKPEVS